MLAPLLFTVLGERAHLLDEIFTAADEVGVGHFNWADLVASWGLGNMDRGNEVCAVVHEAIAQALGF